MAPQAHEPVAVAAPPAPAKSVWFPLGYKDSFLQWCYSDSLELAEHKLLSMMPFITPPRPPTVPKAAQFDPPLSLSDPYGNRRWKTQSVRLDKSNMSLNEFSVERDNESPENTLVVLHGYGAGLGFYFKNFEAISRDPKWKLYALDLPGMGRSERVKPPFQTSAPIKDHEIAVTQAENWFVDAIEEWRKVRGIDRFTLLGHSMGGYLSVAYCLRHPGRVEKLILASPVGIPASEHASVKPEALTSASKEELHEAEIDATADVLEGEFRSSNKDRIPGPSRPNSSQRVRRDSGPGGGPARSFPKLASYIWNKNISPFSFIRNTGPFGPRLVSGWTSRRFAHLTEDQETLVHNYAYNIFRQPGSGEYALPHLLAPGAYARHPMIHRIAGLKRAGPGSSAIPTTFLYGDSDWMDVKGGYASVHRLADDKVTGSYVNPNAYGADGSKVIIVPQAGHNLFIDAHESFNSAILDELKDVVRSRASPS